MGNLDYKVEVHAKDEIGMLVESFNRMTKDLNRALTGFLEKQERDFITIDDLRFDLVFIDAPYSSPMVCKSHSFVVCWDEK